MTVSGVVVGTVEVVVAAVVAAVADEWTWTFLTGGRGSARVSP